MVILPILLILLHHRDTIPEVYLICFNLTLYLKSLFSVSNNSYIAMYVNSCLNPS